MLVDNIDIDSINSELSQASVVKKKRERKVLFHNDLYYKIWDRNWSESEIVDYALKAGFYDKEIAGSLKFTIFDDSGPRGYACHSGIQLHDNSESAWARLISKTSIEDRFNFIFRTIKNSLVSGGIYSDLAPQNIIIYNNKISFIDLESFHSFSMIFDRRLAPYEKFNLDAWWKPHETAKRDVDLFYKRYLKKCLDIEYNKTIKSVENIIDIYNILS